MLIKDATMVKLCQLQQQKINGTMQPRERINCETTKPSKINNRSQDPQPNFGDVDCNFLDEMIDENVGISFLPTMVSRDNPKLGVMHGYTESICSVLKSLDIIENLCQKEQPVEKKKKVNVKLSSKNKENLNNKGVQPVTISRSPLKLKQSALNPNCRLLKNMSEHFIRKEKKIQNLKEQIEENEMKECTFKPHCNNPKSQEKIKTNLNEFLKKQQEHIAKIQKKKQSIRKKDDEAKKAQESFKPKINKNYPQTNRTVNTKPAYQRLYELNTTKLKNNAVQEQVHEFKPTRSPVVQRQKSTLGKSKCGHGTSLFLYEDAERRKNMKKSIERSKENVQHHLPKFVTKTSEIYLQKKFVKQYCYVLDCLGFLSAETQTESVQPQKQTNFEQEIQDENFQEQNIFISKPQHKQKTSIRHSSNAQTYRTNASYSTRNLNEEINRKFTLHEFIKILSKLGFLAYAPDEGCEINQLAAQQKNLAFQAYQTLQQYEVNVRNVFIFLLAVLGIFEAQGNDGFDTINNSNNNQLRLTEKEGRRLHHYFDLLYRNRLSSSNTIIQKTDRSQPQNSPCQSPSHISTTNTLAEKYRSKMIERANQTFISNNIDIVLPTENMLAHEDLLVIDSIGRNLQIKKLRQEKKSYVDDECTFHPKTNQSHGYARAHTDRGIQKCRQLYQYAKSKHELAKNQENIFNDEIEKSPNRDHSFLQQRCFHEEKTARGGKTARETKQKNNRTSKGESKRMNTCIDVKDVDKTVARIALARKEREMKKKLVERGEPDFRQKKKNFSSHSKTNSSMIPSRSEPSVPCFGMHSPTALFTPTILEPQEYHMSEPGDDQPFLVIDINMGEEVDHIEFYVGDERRVGQIVDQFCVDHDLDDECKQQLLQLVEVEMAKYLNNIGDSTED